MIPNDNLSPIPGKSQYLTSRSQDAEILPGYRRDASWVRASFIAPFIDNGKTKQLAMDPVDIRNMSFSTANFKYYDTSPGGSACINPVPSFTSFADIRVKGVLSRSKTHESIEYDPQPMGPGRYHSETFDDHMQVIHIRFGVPSYNSLTTFFTGFYNSSAGSLARTGRYELSWAQKFLKFAAGVISLILMPLAIIPVLFIFAGQAVRFLMKIPSSKFYYLKPAMPAYWLAVANMYNQLAVNMGMVKYTQENLVEQFIDQKYNFTPDNMSIFNQIFPEFTDRGVLDVCGVAGRYKRLEANHRNFMIDKLREQGADGFYGKVRDIYQQEALGLQQTDAKETLPKLNKSPLNRLWEWFNATDMSKTLTGSKQDSMIEKDLRQSPELSGVQSVAEAERMLTSEWKGVEKESLWKYFVAESDDGSAYASFRVNNTGPASSSFSNSTAQNSLAQKLNAGSSSARDLQINLAGGNIDPWGISKSILSGVGSVLSTAADILQVSGLAAFAGNAFVDIPDHWESSSAEISSMSYTIDLVSPYNNPISQMLNIYLPLCMLIAGALPLSTGKSSHQSPYLCEVYDRGRCISRCAVFESLTVERGTAHTAWTKDGNAIGVKVTLRIKDLSGVVAMPIQNGMSLFPLEGIFADDNNFNDMLMSWSGLSLREVTDSLPKLRRQLDNKVANYATYFSASRLMMDMGQSPIGALASVFMAGTNKK